MTIVFASNNENKIMEIRSILGNSFSLLSLDEINIREDIPENEPQLEGNALSKARYINNATGLNVFADDTGLEIEALNGLPGVHSARFAGDARDSSENIIKVLNMLGKGTIINERRGDKGFGYDPVFIPDGKTRTFAEMDLDEKNKTSHRARAFNKLREFLYLHQNSNNNEMI
jgi:XTP/dITP diphosphohydrolase